MVIYPLGITIPWKSTIAMFSYVKNSWINGRLRATMCNLHLEALGASPKQNQLSSSHSETHYPLCPPSHWKQLSEMDRQIFWRVRTALVATKYGFVLPTISSLLQWATIIHQSQQLLATTSIVPDNHLEAKNFSKIQHLTDRSLWFKVSAPQ